MTDTFSKPQRSNIMRSVRATGTGAEIKCEKLLRALKIRFRKHPRNLPGRPDFVLPDSKVALFVHGCFWHGHKSCKHSALPTSNLNYWVKKIGKNQIRERKVRRSLRKAGWRTAVLWECKLRDCDSVARRLLQFAQSRGIRK